jgi:hypothetical protein
LIGQILRLNRDDFFQDEIRHLIIEGFVQANEMYGNQYDWSRFPIMEFIKSQRLTMCFRDETPVGFLMATLGTSFFDSNIFIEEQQDCFHWKNYRPLSKKINISKSNKIDDELIKQHKILSDNYEKNTIN